MNATQMCSGTSYTISQVEIDNNSMAFCQTEDSNSAVSCLATQIGTFTLNYTVTGVSIEKNYSVIFDVTNYTSSVSTVVATESCLDFTQQNLTHPDGNTTWLRNTTQFCTGGNFTVSNVVFDNLSMAFCQTENNDSAVSCLATQTGNFTLNFTVSGSTLEKNYSIPFVVTNFTQTSVTNNAPVCGTTSYSLTNPDGNTTFNHTITSTCTDVDYDNVTIIDFTNSYSTVSCSVSSDNVTLTCSSTATGNEVIYYTVTDGQVNTTGNISVSVTSFTESTSS